MISEAFKFWALNFGNMLATSIFLSSPLLQEKHADKLKTLLQPLFGQVLDSGFLLSSSKYFFDEKVFLKDRSNRLKKRES